MPDRPTLIRQWQMLRRLSASRDGVSVRELADCYVVSDKTVRRDLAAIAEGGFSLVEATTESRLKLWRVELPHHLANPVFDFGEIAALFIGSQFMEPLAGTLFWYSSRTAFAKLQSYFGKDALQYVESLRGAFFHTSIGGSDYSERAEMIDGAMVGIEERRVTRILYCPARSETPKEYTLHLLGLVYHRGTLYLIASSPDRLEPRHFKVDRLRHVSVTREQFQRPPDFDLRRHLQNSFGVFEKGGEPQAVRIQFSGEASRYVSEHRWHHSQTIEVQSDDSLVVELQLSDLTEVKSWILGFGSAAVVLAPDSLRAVIHEEAELLVHLYSEKQPKKSAATGPESHSQSRKRK